MKFTLKFEAGNCYYSSNVIVKTLRVNFYSRYTIYFLVWFFFCNTFECLFEECFTTGKKIYILNLKKEEETE